jgi:membrane protease YdiL (CAAX protease family)
MIVELVQILLLFVLPSLLIYKKIIPFKYRKQTLLIVSLTTIILMLYERRPLIENGIRIDNLISSIIPYIIFTILSVLVILAVAKILKRKPQAGFYKDKKYILTIAIGSILQELLFRGFLFPKLQYILGHYLLVIFVNAILFTWIHTVYKNTPITLFAIFIAGLAFAGIYAFYPNLFLIAIAHIILNQVAVRYNFYREEKIGYKRIAT